MAVLKRRYKYSGQKGKGYARGSFRCEKPYVGTTTKGWGWIQGCETYIPQSRRWEGFAIVKGSKHYKTKAQALKHKPKW